MNKAKDKLAKKEEEEKKEEETPADIALLTEIRDLLKKEAWSPIFLPNSWMKKDRRNLSGGLSYVIHVVSCSIDISK